MTELRKYTSSAETTRKELIMCELHNTVGLRNSYCFIIFGNIHTETVQEPIDRLKINVKVDYYFLYLQLLGWFTPKLTTDQT